jgi:hypothetical protein
METTVDLFDKIPKCRQMKIMSYYIIVLQLNRSFLTIKWQMIIYLTVVVNKRTVLYSREFYNSSCSLLILIDKYGTMNGMRLRKKI